MKNVIKIYFCICFLVVYSSILSAQIIPNGTYQIYSDVHQEAMVTATTGDYDVSMTTPNFLDNKQLWVFEHQGANVYKIKNVQTGSYIGIKDGWCGIFGDVQARYLATDANVEFLISEGTNTGSYVFQIAFTTCNFGSVNVPVKAFDIQDGLPGAQIQTFDVNASNANQQFRLISSEWNGSASTDWGTASNWTPNSVPTTSSYIRVPNVTNQPTITTSVEVQDIFINTSSSLNVNNALTVAGDFTNLGSVTVNAGSSLLISGANYGDITYNVNVPDVNWHLVASPVVGEQYDDAWVTNNGIAISGTNRGVSTYNNVTSDVVTGHWRYFQGGTTEDFATGTGYALKKQTTGGDFSFTGTIPTLATPLISQGANNWNLIGNSFPSYMDIGAFIASNGIVGSDLLSDAYQAVYVWNASTASYDPLTTGYVHPGQAFFVNSKVPEDNASITSAMQSHQTGVPFYKSDVPSLTLNLSDGVATRKTTINYTDSGTKGLDAGLDIGMFNGVNSGLNVYTHLVDTKETIPFAKQTLPITELETMVIPIGVHANAGKNLNFSVETQNLPSDVNVYLEDRDAGTFTEIGNASYEMGSDEIVVGVGRFYIHISSKSPTAQVHTLDDVLIFQKDKNLHIMGLTDTAANVTLFDVLGKKVLQTTFNASNSSAVALPELSSSIYILKVDTKNGTLRKKLLLE
ncbi:T9SS type A sorting domain-containing protein [Tenacibaculum tangerinum]|uniref:T9SS type A sorting domain-containing protein n=1 Tax=Tenacibaculum tangerinum TaxID=3038772 RepID=A0ABY8L4H2_9FLAO|nr:T9SS type A sorting domain-containing protein [Tenacibaculum tangerinum]WGH76327.1 T9SS type A sorting domain-containing protein [Tenacibaculum tangerinum]